MASSLEVFVSDRLWVREYPVRLVGARFNARMTLVKLASGQLVVHSPCAFDGALIAEVAALGPVAAIIAPGTLHWLHVRSCQQAFPEALTYVCPGLERRAWDFQRVILSHGDLITRDAKRTVAQTWRRILR